MSFPYTTKPTSISPFLDHIHDAGVPTSVTQTYLESVGFKSKNDRPLIGLLKELGFLDNSGKPTARYRQYRDKGQSGAVLAVAIREAYSDLFQLYPDACRRDNEALSNFFKSNSDFSDGTIGFVIRTLKALCDRADFETVEPPSPEAQSAMGSGASPTLALQSLPSAPLGPTININIQLELPKTDDAAVYENLFKAMQKHLFDGGTADS